MDRMGKNWIVAAIKGYTSRVLRKEFILRSGREGYDDL
jgi:hypothetical protein